MARYAAKHMKKSRMNIPMCLAFVLFCLTLFSMHFTNGLYARYVVSDSGRDEARVVKFGELTLTETGDFADGSAYIIPGVDLKKEAKVSFTGSEAATYVFVEVTPSAQWKTITADHKTFALSVNEKNVMQWSVADGWEYVLTTDGTYVYYCPLAPNMKLEAAPIIAEDGEISVSASITKNDLNSMTGISITLRAAVVQSGGFESPAAAWTSLAAKEG